MSDIIRAKDVMPRPEDMEGYRDIDDWDGLLIRLFGMLPDYSNEKLDDLWNEVNDGERDEYISYCKKRGVDVMDDDGRPVPPWRDIAVMLIADEKGLL